MPPGTPTLFETEGSPASGCSDRLDYRPAFFEPEESRFIFDALQARIQWGQETLVIFGRPVLTPRLTAWYGDAGTAYSYSGKTFYAKPWTDELAVIRDRAQQAAGERFNSVLLNLYRDGRDSMGWHSDDEPELGINPVIASVNFGAERRLDFRLKNHHAVKHSIMLANGSLLVMKGDLQHHWQHQVAKTAKVTAQRINLTFRNIKNVC